MTQDAQCPRCLKHLFIRHDDDGVHTCSPTKQWGSMERELAQAKELLANQKELIMHLYGQLNEAKKK